MSKTPRVVVIGAGVGGLTAAATLAAAGIDVQVLEAHVYPGGCAGTFFHKNFRFDAGATLAGGFYPGGPMDLVATRTGIRRWQSRPTTTSMAVHLPTGETVHRYGDERRWAERAGAFGTRSEPFWRWQERTADALWDLALQLPPWPPQRPADFGKIGAIALGWLRRNRSIVRPTLVGDAFSPLATHLRGQSDALRHFINGQLLIAAQATSEEANALYGASALDLPRRGVVHLEGGMGKIAEQLATALTGHGGEIHYRQTVTRIVTKEGRPRRIETGRGMTVEADAVIVNLPPWNVAALLDPVDQPRRISALPPMPKAGWGAFMAYVGVDDSAVPEEFPLHHQVISRQPYGEGNTIFISLSPKWDTTRAPQGQRALTISTHTELAPWWSLFERDREAYEARKAHYLTAMLESAERVLPTLRQSASLIKAGTPVTFRRFTRREWGWVGGFPKPHSFRLGDPVWRQICGWSVTVSFPVNPRLPSRWAASVLQMLYAPHSKGAYNGRVIGAVRGYGPELKHLLK